MKTPKQILLAIGSICFLLVGVALILQHGADMLPCPFCILQRYAFITTGVVCFIVVALPRKATAPGAMLAASCAMSGAGIAGRHLWVKAHPTMSCGIDPLETSLNSVVLADLMPFLLKADGLCTDEYNSFLGLSIPFWSAAWFGCLAAMLIGLVVYTRWPVRTRAAPASW